MNFDRPDRPVTSGDLSGVEQALGLAIPVSLKNWYLRFNGGRPTPYVYEDDNLDTVVASFLPILTGKGARTAVDAYQHLVLKKGIVPLRFLPFAVDGGGDYFFVDCADGDGPVYFYRSDPPSNEQPLLSLGVTIADFWARLKPE